MILIQYVKNSNVRMICKISYVQIDELHIDQRWSYTVGPLGDWVNLVCSVDSKSVVIEFIVVYHGKIFTGPCR